MASPTTIVALILGSAVAANGNVLWQDVCSQPDVKGKVWCDTTKPRLERAKAFVADLTTDEKIPIMVRQATRWRVSTRVGTRVSSRVVGRVFAALCQHGLGTQTCVALQSLSQTYTSCPCVTV